MVSRADQRGSIRGAKLDLGDLSGPLAIDSGGTGSTAALQARISLGLKSMSTQSSTAVAITGGAISGTSIASSNVSITGGTFSGDSVAATSGVTGSSASFTSITGSSVMKPGQFATASKPAYAVGAMYFDTTLSKLRVGGASTWETVTSI